MLLGLNRIRQCATISSHIIRKSTRYFQGILTSSRKINDQKNCRMGDFTCQNLCKGGGGGAELHERKREGMLFNTVLFATLFWLAVEKGRRRIADFLPPLFNNMSLRYAFPERNPKPQKQNTPFSIIIPLKTCGQTKSAKHMWPKNV